MTRASVRRLVRRLLHGLTWRLNRWRGAAHSIVRRVEEQGTGIPGGMRRPVANLDAESESHAIADVDDSDSLSIDTLDPDDPNGFFRPGQQAAGLASLPIGRRSHFDFYRMEFATDGYPCRRTERGLIPHPIYPPYVIRAYLDRYRRTGDPQYVDAACKVAEAALDRTSPVGEVARVMWYEPAWGISLLEERYYSGLTSARYMSTLFELYEVSGRPSFADAATASFKSLTVPTSEGGVLLQTPFGPLIEELPHAIPTMVLNGWTTVIVQLLEYGNRSANAEAREFALENIRTLEKVISRYDVPQFALSRYQLTGFCDVRVSFDDPEAAAIVGARTRVNGQFHELRSDVGYWNNHISTTRGAPHVAGSFPAVVVNAVFSLIEDRQVFEVDLVVTKPTAVTFELGGGDLEPRRSFLRRQRWLHLGTRNVDVGSATVSFEVDNRNFELVAHPTNFGKRFPDGDHNVYHRLHISNLETILRFQPSEPLADFARKWEKYIDLWPTVPAIADSGVSLTAPPR